jgi:hypothetical protein
MAYHNAARKLHWRYQREAFNQTGIDIHDLETTIPSPKTLRVNRYLQHIRSSISAYSVLYSHYKRERLLRWKTYRKTQKAVYELCMRAKGDRSLRNDQVVVAYGGGQFASNMKGKRGVPVKLFRRALSRYVTVVMVDEYRTSRVCSNRCILESVNDEDALDDGEAEVEDDAVNILEEDEGGGGDGDDDDDDTAQQNTRRAEYVLPCFILHSHFLIRLSIVT